MLKIAFVGQQCSGKTSCTNALARTCIAQHGPDSVVGVKFADPIYGALAAVRQPKHRVFMQEFGDLAKRHFGEMVFVDIFRKNVTACAEDASIQLLLCDDIRRKYELDMAHDLGFHVIYVHAPVEVRKARAEVQGLEFKEDHNSESEVPSLRDHCAYVLDGGVSMAEMLVNMRSTLKGLAVDGQEFLHQEAA